MNKTLKIHLYRIFETLFLITLFLSCKGYYYIFPLRFQKLYTILYYLLTIVSTLLLITCIKKEYKNYRWIFKYLVVILVFFLFPQFIYTFYKYNQGIIEFLKASVRYFFFIWSVPLLYIMKEEKKLDCFLKKCSLVLFIGYFSVFINVFLKSHYSFTFFHLENWNMRKGNFRILDISPFTPIIILYNWYKILNHSANKFNYMVVIFILFVTIYIEQTRMLIIIYLFTLIIMFLLKKRETMNKIVLNFFIVICCLICISCGVFNNFFSQFSIENNGVSTVYRINELKFYIERFNDNKLFGIGILPQEQVYEIYNISSSGNMNPDDIGIFGSLGLIGFGNVIVFLFPLLHFIKIYFNLKRNNKNNCIILLGGIIIYMISSSFTLFIFNFQRIALFPIFISIFEYCNFLYGKKSTLEED